MTAQATPEVGELFVSPRGTRHRITHVNPFWIGTPCSGGVMRAVFDAGPYAYQRECRACFPDAADNTRADLERARDIAVQLEQENAELLRQIHGGRQLVIELHRNGILSDPEAAVLFGTLRGVLSPAVEDGARS